MTSSTPVSIPALPTSVHEDLATRRQWVCWKEGLNEDGKSTKFPYDPNIPNGNGRKKASSKNPDEWGTFETASSAVEKLGADGIGFVFTDQDPFTGIDLDKCRNPETGEIKQWALEFIRTLNSYTEVSPSGTGVHVLVRGNMPDGSRCSTAYEDGKVEIYSRTRYFTMTGKHLAGTPQKIEERQTELQAVHGKVFGSLNGKAKTPTAERSTAPMSMNGAELLEKIRFSRQRDKFDRLWAGDTSEHGGDDSAADLALCSILAFWTAHDWERIDQLFRQSGLMRDKWDREDYRNRTITKACESTTETYSPPKDRTGAATHRNGATAYKEPDIGKLSELPLDALVEQGDAIEQVKPQDEPGDDSQGETEPNPERSVKDAPYPKPIGEEGYYGVVGKIVAAIEPHTEADPNFLLVSLLVAAGNYLDHKAHIEVSGVRHYTNLFVCGVGATGTGRKGTAMANALWFLEKLEDGYSAGETSCIERSSLSSGEGLIARIKDDVREAGENPGEWKLIEPGRKDKRVISIQDELGPALQNMKRSGNNLSGILRIAWDGGDLGSLTKSPYRATKPHVSMITGTTREELFGGIEDELMNGFANRFLWCCSKQSKMLPEGGNLHDVNVEDLAASFMSARSYAASAGLVRRDAEANDYWGYNDSPHQGLYAKLNKPHTGKFSKCVTRAHVMVLRMALIFALLDYGKDSGGNPLPCEIRKEHLFAAEEVWRYCEDSARYIFGGAVRNEMADAILDYLRSVGPEGATRTEICQKVFRNNKTAEEITTALSHLLNDYENPLFSCQAEKRPGAQRTTQVYRAL